MFKLAYPACVALGAVLLQISPQRGIPGNRMESFLRGMREVRISLALYLTVINSLLYCPTTNQIERHPQVLHLPPPHIWQLTPAEQDPLAHGTGAPASQSLVVTLELRVAKELDDREVVKLTRWAWERTVISLGMNPEREGGLGEGEGLGVTVGVVRA